MKLSIVVPAYHEAGRIKESLFEILAFCRRELEEWEVIVVDDGSTDTTSAEAALAGRVRLLRNDRNRGKGYSVRRGMLAARYDPVLFTDADLSTPIEEALALHAALEKGNDIAIASRRPDPRKEVRRSASRRLMAHGFRLAVKLIALRGFYDTQCGFKMFRANAVQAVFPLQRLERWGFDVELLYLARKRGLKIAEVPVSWNESSASALRAVTPLEMLVDLLRVRWNDVLGRYRSPSPSGGGAPSETLENPPGRGR